MKQYPRIFAKLFYEPLLITPQKHRAICRVLEARMSGDTMGPMPDPPDDPEPQNFGSTAIIPIHGIIGQHLDNMEMMSGGCDLDNVDDMIEVAANDPSIDRLIFNFNTPGGSVTGVRETAARIFDVRKETVAFTDSECCSAGLWLASQCQKFYSTASASIGSVGVWTAYLDLSRQMANEGENMQAISAGKHKLMGAYWKPLTSEETAIIQKSVDKLYTQFKDAVNAHRQIADETLATALIYDGEEAAEIGFTDGVVGSFDDVLDGMMD